MSKVGKMFHCRSRQALTQRSNRSRSRKVRMRSADVENPDLGGQPAPGISLSALFEIVVAKNQFPFVKGDRGETPVEADEGRLGVITWLRRDELPTLG